MKILHTADWHLGKRLERFDRTAEQREVLEEIISIAEAEQVDVVLIAGDLYDTFNPPTEATEIFYKTLKKLSKNGQRPVIAIAGNHDSPDRIEAPDPLARECGILFSGYPNSEIPLFELENGLRVLQSEPGFIEIGFPLYQSRGNKNQVYPTEQLEDSILNALPPLRLLLTPYANETRLRRDLGTEDTEQALRDTLENHWARLAKKYCDDQGVNILMTHLFMVKKGEVPPDEPDDERPINVGGASAVYTSNLPKGIQYTALGHLHRRITMDMKPCPVIYSGSLLSYSFAEAGQQKSVTILELEPGKEAVYKDVPLTRGLPLVRKTFGDIDECVVWLTENQECYVELTLILGDYLRPADRKRIMQAHPRIVGPIPMIRQGKERETEITGPIDLGVGVEQLFADYFREKHGQVPNEQLMDLFREIRGKGEDE